MEFPGMANNYSIDPEQMKVFLGRQPKDGEVE